MSSMYAVIFDSQKGFLDIDDLTPKIRKAARISVNRASEKARTRSARMVRAQINVPASYVAPGQGRLVVKTRATDDTLESQVSARKRPTSLARFSANAPRAGQKGVRVQVKPGFAKYMRAAFFVKLRAGSADIDTKYNVGLAVRTANGAKPDRAYAPVPLGNGLWLLYGPSVSQALLSARDTGIWPNMVPEIQKNLGDEFLRVLEL